MAVLASVVRDRFESVRCAARGIRVMLATQHNARVHLAATGAACALGALLGLSRLEWTALVLALVAVWAAEGLNTALELLCDVASPEFHPLVEQAKDVAAGAVLLTALGSLAVGLLIFAPRLLRLVT